MEPIRPQGRHSVPPSRRTLNHGKACERGNPKQQATEIEMTPNARFQGQFKGRYGLFQGSSKANIVCFMLATFVQI